MAGLAGATATSATWGRALRSRPSAGCRGAVALIFCFDTILVFSLVPFLMALAAADRNPLSAMALDVAKKMCCNPFHHCNGASGWRPRGAVPAPVALDGMMEFLQNAAAPCALFALGVTVALRHTKTRVGGAAGGVGETRAASAAARCCYRRSGRNRELVYPPCDGGAAAALNAFIIAPNTTLWVQQASSSVLLGTLLSVVTLTGTMWLVEDADAADGSER